MHLIKQLDETFSAINVLVYCWKRVCPGGQTSLLNRISNIRVAFEHVSRWLPAFINLHIRLPVYGKLPVPTGRVPTLSSLYRCYCTDTYRISFANCFRYPCIAVFPFGYWWCRVSPRPYFFDGIFNRHFVSYAVASSCFCNPKPSGSVFFAQDRFQSYLFLF